MQQKSVLGTNYLKGSIKKDIICYEIVRGHS